MPDAVHYQVIIEPRENTSQKRCCMTSLIISPRWLMLRLCTIKNLEQITGQLQYKDKQMTLHAAQAKVPMWGHKINPTVTMIRLLNIPSALFWQKGIRANLCDAQAALVGATQAGIKTLKMYVPRNRSTGIVGRQKRCYNLMTLYSMSGLTDNSGSPFQPGLESEVLIVKFMLCALSSIWVWWVDNVSLYLHMTGHTPWGTCCHCARTMW